MEPDTLAFWHFCALRMQKSCVIMNTQCVLLVYGDSEMDSGSRMRKLRESTGMNRKEFCQFFEIPYRTVTDWELDNRHAPEYVFRLLEYYIRHENLRKKTEKNELF